MKRLNFGAFLILLSFILFPSVRAFGYPFYGGCIDLKQYRGTYKELNEVYFDIYLTGYKITDLTDANITVNGAVSSSTIADYLIQGDQCRIIVPIDGKSGNKYSVAISPGKIKVCKNDADPSTAIYLKDAPGLSSNVFDRSTVQYYVNELDQYNAEFSSSLNRSMGDVKMVGGTYELTYHAIKESTWNDLTNYRHDADAPTEAKIMRKETDGSYTTVMTGASVFYKTSVTATFDRIITEPGEYYVLYPLQGVMSYMNTRNDQVSTGAYHTSNVLKGPFVISEGATGSRVSTLMLSWDQPGEYFSDALPDQLKLVASNAIDLFPVEDAQSSLTILNKSTKESVKLDITPTLEKTSVLLDVSGQLAKPGTYTVTYTPAGAFTGINNDDFILNVPLKQTYSMDIKVTEPKHPETLDLYVRSGDADEYELAEGESVEVHLSHSDRNSGVTIYTRWTALDEPAPASVAAKAVSDIPEGFSEHTGDITLDGAGTLEYFTRVSNTNSAIRKINVKVAAKPQEDPDVPTGVQDIMSDRPGDDCWYDLKGNQVADPGTGIYIRRKTDGTADKVLRR